MTITHRLALLAIACIFSSSSLCFAGEPGVPGAAPDAPHAGQGVFAAGTYEGLLLADASTGAQAAAGEPSTGSGLNAARLHPYLGYATVLLAGITAVSSGTKGIHWTAAYGTAGMAALTVTTGALAHGKRFDLKEGLLSEDNLHIILGTLGAAGCLAAVAMADSDGGGSHAGAGVAGGVLMALSIIDIRW
jgi:hypothetical protein